MKTDRMELVLGLAPWVRAPAHARHAGASTIWVTDLTGDIDTGWVVTFPNGASDYFNVSHEVVAGVPNSEEVVDGLNLTGLSLSLFDFCGCTTFPLVGAYYPFLAL